MRLKEIGEDGFIKGLSEAFKPRSPRILKAIGDDTSVTVQKAGKALLVTTDILIEDTHFKASYTPFYLLGRKALSISLSDIAAMGAEPLFFMASVAFAPSLKKSSVDELYAGLKHVAEAYGVELIGGNTARSDKLMVSTTVIGEASPKKVVYRKGAKTGDLVFVTGELGSSALGLKELLSSGYKKAIKGPFMKAVLAHLDPVPRLEAGRALAERKLASAMMDISDGLAIDLGRLCGQSGVSAVVKSGSIPVGKRYGAILPEKTALELALTGGEDYELVFTSSPKNASRILALSAELGLPITPVGHIIGKTKDPVKVLGPGGAQTRLKAAGFQHF